MEPQSRGDDERAGAIDRIDPFARGIDRRRLLQTSAVVGTTASLAGCLSEGGESGPTAYVFNNGDRTVSVIDTDEDTTLGSPFVDTTASFPANQYGTGGNRRTTCCGSTLTAGFVGSTSTHSRRSQSSKRGTGRTIRT